MNAPNAMKLVSPDVNIVERDTTPKFCYTSDRWKEIVGCNGLTTRAFDSSTATDELPITWIRYDEYLKLQQMFVDAQFKLGEEQRKNTELHKEIAAIRTTLRTWENTDE